MRAKVKRIGNKFRLVHGPNNQILKRNGHAVDGGGHQSGTAAEKQARAINRAQG